MPHIEFENVGVTFDTVTGQRTVLHDINLSLNERRIGIIGANGSGKSTLVRLINGLADPTSGQVRVAGLDVAKRGREVRRKVGFVFSDADNQIIMPTVAEDVAFSLRTTIKSGREREAKAAAMLRTMGLEHLADASPHFLSGGEKQLLALASVLVVEPELVIADEPTTLLDLGNRRMIARRLAKLPQQLIVVSHDLELLEDMERVLWIADGKVREDGPADRVIADYVASFGG